MAAGCAALMALGTGNAMAQGRGNFDPAQRKQEMMDRLRDQMEIKDDQEWQAIEPKLSKTIDAGRDVMMMRGRGMFGGGRRRNNNNGGDNGGDNANARPRRNPFGEPSAAIRERVTQAREIQRRRFVNNKTGNASPKGAGQISSVMRREARRRCRRRDR